MENKEKFKEGELLNLMEVLKDEEVKAKNLLVRVYDVETKKEGWIAFEQIINNLSDTLMESMSAVFIGKEKSNG